MYKRPEAKKHIFLKNYTIIYETIFIYVLERFWAGKTE